MDLKEILSRMFHSYFIILTGTLTAAAVFCSIFANDAAFGVDMFWKMLLLALLTDLPLLLFYSRKEISNKGWIAREILHFGVIIAILLYFGYTWEWIEPSFLQTGIFIALVVGVYAAVRVIVFQLDKKTAEQLNKGIKKYNETRTRE
jgi:hypothetical protein